MSLRTDIQGFAPDARGWTLAQFDLVEGASQYGEDAGLRYWVDAEGTGDSTILRVAAPNVTLRDLCLSNNRGFVTGSGVGILHDAAGTLWGLNAQRVSVLYPGKNCLRLVPAPGQYNVSPTFRDCAFYGAGEDGVVLDTVTDAVFDHVSSTVHNGRGWVLKDCAGARLNVSAEAVNGGILLQNCVACEIKVWAEVFAPEPAIILDNCRACVVRSSVIEDWSGKNPVGILLRSGTTRCVIEPCFQAGVSLSVDDGGCRGNVIHRQTRPSWHDPIPWRVNERRNEVIG